MRCKECKCWFENETHKEGMDMELCIFCNKKIKKKNGKIKKS